MDRVCFDVDWNKEGYLAVGATGSICQIKSFNRKDGKFEQHLNIETFSSVRCVQFNPNNPNHLAIGLFNGNIMIYDLNKSAVH